MKLKDIEFGKARAELEGARYPELLKNGYLDYKGIYDKLESGEKFLVLGHKGCGKSAIGEKLRLEASKKIVSLVHLEDFPFKSFGKIFSGGSEAEAKYPASWSWLLLLMIIDNLRNDAGAKDEVNINYNNSIRQLGDLGFLPTDDINRLIIKSSKTTFKVQIPKILEYAMETSSGGASSDLQFLTLVEYMKKMVIEYSTKCGLIIIIDGLDDILTKREIQYQTLSALIFEVDRLNLFFYKKKKNIHIVVLCRTELYERLPGPNKNKLRQDSAFELNWYHDPNQPYDSSLVKLINLRAKLSTGHEIDVFSEFMCATIDGKETLHYLLDMTRHTPRDLINLMNHLKNFHDNDKMNKSQIFSALRQYSIDYFEPEIRDEMVGYVDSSDYLKFCSLVGFIRQREFTFNALATRADDEGLNSHTLEAVLNALYDCSAIGNKWGTPSGSNRYEFKFRNKNSTLDKSKTIVLHRGLWKALNLV